MSEILFSPKYKPFYDKGFKPIELELRSFHENVRKSRKGQLLKIACERSDKEISVYEIDIFQDNSQYSYKNEYIVERLIKSLLWIRGGHKVYIGGSQSIFSRIKLLYSADGARAFDAMIMSKIYEKPFEVEYIGLTEFPKESEVSRSIGGHIKGYRIGFDVGGSDIKVSAVIDGTDIYSEEIVWNPKTEYDPEYHFNKMYEVMKKAAGKLPKVQAIGVSAAGIYINNRVMVASLFKHLPDDVFDKHVKNIFLEIQREMGNIPLVVANDGDVGSLAGSMALEDSNVLGIAMGTSQAGGYVDENCEIKGWLNELAFVPTDLSDQAAFDDWSGDIGCGTSYFSQDAVIRLANFAGINFDKRLTPAQKLQIVQKDLQKGCERAKHIFGDMGIYLGYTIPYYAEFFDIKHVLLLGRVMSGLGGNVIIDTARKVLRDEYPHLHQKIYLHLPDEKTRRVGQCIAAASLPQI